MEGLLFLTVLFWICWAAFGIWFLIITVQALLAAPRILSELKSLSFLLQSINTRLSYIESASKTYLKESTDKENSTD